MVLETPTSAKNKSNPSPLPPQCQLAKQLLHTYNVMYYVETLFCIFFNIYIYICISYAFNTTLLCYKTIPNTFLHRYVNMSSFPGPYCMTSHFCLMHVQTPNPNPNCSLYKMKQEEMQSEPKSRPNNESEESKGGLDRPK